MPLSRAAAATLAFTVTKPTLSQFIRPVPEHAPWMQAWLTADCYKS